MGYVLLKREGKAAIIGGVPVKNGSHIDVDMPVADPSMEIAGKAVSEYEDGAHELGEDDVFAAFPEMKAAIGTMKA